MSTTERINGAALTPAQVVAMEYEGYLPSPGLDPAWIAGWHAAINHAVHHLAAGATQPDQLAQQKVILEVIGEHRRVRNVRSCSAGGCAWRPSRSGSTSDPDDTMARHQQFNEHITATIMERLAQL